MPTYNAIGISAGLSTCDLQSSLSNVIDKTQGKQQRIDAARIQKVYVSAKKLNERPIGADGSEKGVMQFVGVSEDMPLFVVEAGENVSIKKLAIADVEMGGMDDGEENENVGDTRMSSPLPVFSSDDSPLTSLGATPTPTALSFDQNQSPGKRTQTVGQTPLHQQSLEQALQAAHSLLNPSAKKALILDIELSQSSFLPRPSKGRGVKPAGGVVGRDLKIEIFVNGHLADVSLIPARKSPLHPAKETVHFAGIRVHRQIEKPWLYDSDMFDTLSEDLGENDSTGADTKSKWNAVSSSLVEEARSRGRNKWGDQSPSAEFLTELAVLKTPHRFAGTEGVGIIDVIITAGSGRKLGPETPYIVRPTRMADSNYILPDHTLATPRLNPVGMFDVQEEQDPFHDAEPLKHVLPPAESSPDIPLRQESAMSAIARRPSPATKKEKEDFSKALGLDVDLRLPVGGYETGRHKIGKSGRTLGQRLGDLKKMSPKNRSKAAESLREEFRSALSKKDNAMPLKKLDFNELNKNPSNDELEEVARIASNADLVGNLDPKHMLPPNPPESLQQKPQQTLQPFAAAGDPDAMLTQSRIDMALDSGALSSGPLLRRIASTSPQHTPQKKTRASALAGSPTKVAVKPPKRQKTDAFQTPQRRSKSANDASHAFSIGKPVPFTIPTTISETNADEAVTPVRGSASRGANRSNKKWIPSEQTVEDVLKDFEIPEGCGGSCVTYAEEEGMHRQIGKVRGGTFHEECVVVGMRFVVVG